MNLMRVLVTNQPLGALRFSRAYTLSIEALHTLCCSNGNLRLRLEAVDPEYYLLASEQLPDFGAIRFKFAELKTLATKNDPRWEHDGWIPATLSTAHHTVLKKIAQLVWEIHREFSEYMHGDA
jgi:hypothetical protein